MCSSTTGGILDFCSIYRFFDDFLPEWLAYALAGLVLALVVINVLMMVTAFYTWFERRALGRFQARLGPNRWGPFGLMQPLADTIKLMTKEDIVPDEADRPVFNLAPIAFLVPVLLVVAVIPFGEDSFVGTMNIGVLFILGVTSFNTIAIFMGGWASRNKYAMFGAMRSVAMLISYEVPMALAITGVLLIAGSMSLFEIVKQQNVPFMLVQPLGFFVFVTASLAEISRPPFDQIEAESELGGGYHTEYSGIKFAIFQTAEFMAPVIMALIVTTLFLSGYRGFDPVPVQLWFVIKVSAVVLVIMWIRATWPRLRVDQITGIAWKGLFALALVNLFVVAIEVSLLQNEEGRLTTNAMWLMAAINWVVTIVSVVAVANVMGHRRLRPPAPVASPLANMSVEAD